MGWTYMSRPASVKDELSRMCTFEGETIASRCLDVAIVKLRTAYAAVESIDKETRKRTVYAVIFLLDYRGEDDPYNFGYKDIDETMGAHEDECPERILNLLTDPPLNKYAADWRARCKDRILQRKMLPRLTAGMYIRTDEPIKFSDGTRCQDFQIENARRVTLYGRNGRRYRVPRAELNRVGYS